MRMMQIAIAAGRRPVRFEFMARVWLARPGEASDGRLAASHGGPVRVIAFSNVESQGDPQTSGIVRQGASMTSPVRVGTLESQQPWPSPHDFATMVYCPRIALLAVQCAEVLHPILPGPKERTCLTCLDLTLCDRGAEAARPEFARSREPRQSRYWVEFSVMTGSGSGHGSNEPDTKP